MNLEELGFTKEELQDRVVEAAVERLFTSSGMDDNGDVHYKRSIFREKMEKLIAERIDNLIKKFADEQILPKIDTYVENLVLTETNKWGEKQKAPVTFVEYLTKRAEDYITETVDYNGKSKSEGDSYSWSGKQSRIAHMIHRHLHYNVESAVKTALQDLNSKVAGGVENTVKITLQEVLNNLKVGVKTS